MMEKAGIRVGLTLMIAGAMLLAMPVNMNLASSETEEIQNDLSTIIYVNGYAFDCMVGEPDIPAGLRAQAPASGMEGLYLVHFTGPIYNKWTEAVQSAGGQIITYIDHYAYEVRMTPEEAAVVDNLYFVDWVGLYHPAYKIQQGIEGLDVIVTMNRNELSLNTADKLKACFVSGEGSALPDGHIFIGRLADASYMSVLATDPDVQFIEQHFPEELHDEMGMQITGGFAWINDPDSNINTPYRTLGTHGSYANQLGWDGTGVTVGIADSGGGDGTTPNMGHVDFTGRVIGGIDLGATVNGWNDQHGHGTHCAGLMAGDTYEGSGLIYAGAAKYYVAMGQAHESQIFVEQIFEGTTATFDAPADYGDILTAGYTGGARVHSNSWGSETSGAYSASDQAYDTRVRDASTAAGNQQLVVVCSAGNAGSATGTIGSPGNGKNVITVGSYYNYMPDGSTYGYSSTDRNNPDTVSSFSSRGWSDYTGGGRIKPDIAAPGEETLSTKSPQAASALYGTYTPDGRYQWCSGTSQACPTVTGGAAVVYQWGTSKLGAAPSPAIVKALLINSAVDMGTADIPNQNEGWGRMYLPTIVDPTSQWILKDNQPELTTGAYAEMTFSYVSNTKPLKVTLAWTDKNAVSGDTTPLVNNLDLRLTSPTGLVYHGNAFAGGVTPAGTNPSVTFDINADGWDETNNVECIYIAPASLQTGTYTLRVTGFNIAGDADNDGSNDQDYSLAIYNAAQYAHASATGPLGATNNVAVTLTYDWVGIPTSVNLYYTKTAGASWTLCGNDATVDGSYPYTITAGTGTYAWYASAVGGSTIDVSPPPAGTTPEASSLVYDLTAPSAPSNLDVDQYGEGVSGGTNILTTTGTTAAGGPHNVWFTIVDSSAGTELTTPNSVAEFTDTYYTNAGTSNDVRAGPSSTPGVGTYEFLKCQYATAIDPATVSSLTLTFEGYFAAALTATMFAWDGSAWDTLGTAAIATTDTTMAMTVTVNPGQYLVGGNVLWGVYAGSARRSCTVDFLEVRIENAVPYTTYDDNTMNWTASASGDVDHYNVYRSDLQAGTYTLIGSSPVGTNTYQDDGKGQADSTYWWYRVRAVDGAGNEETNTVSVQEPAPTVNPPYAISLTGKAANSWVFVSFPSDMTGTIQEILNDATAGDGGTTWSVAKWYNPATPSDPWKTYRVGGTANDMPTIDFRMGFWVYITANGGDQALTLGSYGPPVPSTVISLAQGWNLVGYPSTTDRLGTTTPAQVTVISAYSASAAYTDYTNKGLVTLHHGNAYFMYATAATTWTVTTP